MLHQIVGERPTHFLQQFRRGQVNYGVDQSRPSVREGRLGACSNWTGKRGLKITRFNEPCHTLGWWAVIRFLCVDLATTDRWVAEG